MLCQYRPPSYMASVVLRITLVCELEYFLLKYMTHREFSIFNFF